MPPIITCIHKLHMKSLHNTRLAISLVDGKRNVTAVNVYNMDKQTTNNKLAVLDVIVLLFISDPRTSALQRQHTGSDPDLVAGLLRAPAQKYKYPSACAFTPTSSKCP